MISDLAQILLSVRITDLIDIIVVSYLLYKILGFIRETRAQQLVQGIVLIVIMYLLSDVLNLSMLNWILMRVLTIGAFALVVIFQPELRRGLEKIGRKAFFTNQIKNLSKEESQDIINNLVEALDSFSHSRTGALIVLERQIMLSDIIQTGVIVNANISSRLLGNLFYEGSPLHDGAIIIRDRKIFAASCVLPLTEKTTIGGNLGTRHRAGIGITEVSDALVIICSEETGKISIAENGILTKNIDIKTLENRLIQEYIPEESKKDIMNRMLGKNR